MEIFKDFDRIIILDHEEEEYDKILFYLFSRLIFLEMHLQNCQ